MQLLVYQGIHTNITFMVPPVTRVTADPWRFHVTAFWQVPHGYLGVLGPVFGSGAYEFASNIIAGYKSTSLPGFNLNLHIFRGNMY